MSETKFTKGEWAILPIENNREYIRIRGVVLGGRYKIANVSDLKNHHNDAEWCKIDRAESMANANLIAAAPDMYKLLIRIQQEGGLSVARHKSISKLLAKARGEK